MSPQRDAVRILRKREIDMRKYTSLLLCLVAAAPALADAMKLEDAPRNVRDAALRAVPGVTLISVSTEIENDRTIYEFKAQDRYGAPLEIDVDESGEMQEVEWPLELNDLPPAVRAALDKAAPNFKGIAERSERPRGVVVYEFEGVSNDGTVDIEINEAGEVTKGD